MCCFEQIYCEQSISIRNVFFHHLYDGWQMKAYLLASCDRDGSSVCRLLPHTLSDSMDSLYTRYPTQLVDTIRLKTCQHFLHSDETKISKTQNHFQTGLTYGKPPTALLLTRSVTPSLYGLSRLFDIRLCQLGFHYLFLCQGSVGFHVLLEFT